MNHLPVHNPEHPQPLPPPTTMAEEAVVPWRPPMEVPPSSSKWIGPTPSPPGSVHSMEIDEASGDGARDYEPGDATGEVRTFFLPKLDWT